MKIIIAHYKYYVQGGPERYMFKFMELAEQHGHTVIPFSVDNNMNINTPYKEYFVKAVDKGSSGRFDASKLTIAKGVKGFLKIFHNNDAYTKLKQLIAAEKPDLLYVLIPGMLSADIFKAAKESDIPVILRISDFRLICGNRVLLRDETICKECIYGNYKHMVSHKCVKHSVILSFIRMLDLYYARNKKTYDYVDAVITPPQHTADIFIESEYFPPDKIFVNPTYIDCCQFPVSNVFKNYVLCLGRFSPEKGFIYVIEALRYLKDIPVKVAVTGNKEDCDQELRITIDKYGLENKIEFVGFIHGKALEKLTAEALCVAAPAIWYENLPNVVLEAYAYGKPVIASNIGSLAEIVEDGITGLLFKPKEPEQIAACIRKLYENPEYCAEMGKNARRKCETDFSPEAHWNRFIKIYDSIKAK